ncbi:NADH:flavin oxidoreductase/NADH oxidase [Symbioplanes lichenis]|uniref:NADH:flavin oxidoreductase/NADH oxidase n=1 Tax=Symbioplanes lichenis TaxID=1629072 RepID=UPI00273970A7|nr:NADH:flavin oxidoreductase/NADH oxidase [Actinoplanes lichenis]
MAALFDPFTIRDVTLPNRVWMAPMCQYSAPVTGEPVDWHVQHYGARATGGPGLILVEATGVSPEGRISHADLGIWSSEQVAGHRRLTALMAAQGVVPGIQLAHAGRKGGTAKEFEGGRVLPLDEGGWQVVGPSEVAFDETRPVPHALTAGELDGVVADFAAAARRAVDAGYQVIEVHAAHGYLIHEFLSPLSNRRDDSYGGSFDNRVRLARRVVAAVRAEIGPGLPLFVRVSATDWVEPEGWTADDTVRLSALLREDGADLIHVSTGGNVPAATIPVGPGYQVEFAERIRRETGLPTAAVGVITDPHQAEKILTEGQADAVALGRQLLVDPFWPRRAALELGADHPLPPQYARAARALHP